MKRFSLRLDDENFKKIEKFKENSNASFNLIINMIIDNFDKNIESKELDIDKSATRKNSMIHLRLTQDEYNFLQEQARLHGFSSATKEVKFRLLSTLYNKNIFSPIEMRELTFAVNNMRKLGANISMLIKAIYSKNSNITFNFENVEKTCDLVKNYIKETSKIIQEYCNILDQRI